MRTGKTEKQIAEIKEQLDNNKTVLVAGLKTPTDYLNKLGDGYVAEESFRTQNMIRVYDEISRAVYWDGGEKVKTGYIFRKL